MFGFIYFFTIFFLCSFAQINDNLKKDLLENAWTPSLNFDFPASTNRNLKFQLKWLSEWSWLIYSPSEDGAFCKYCSLFATGVGHQSVSAGKLVTFPYKNWKNAREEFKRHETLQYHRNCHEKAVNFIATHSGAKPTIDVLIDKGLQSQIRANRERLKPIIKTVAFCAREGIALRGHRDSGPLSMDETTKKGEGHFRALLKFRIEAGDEILKNHLQTAASNASYISWQIQNEIISSFNSILLKNIVSKINEAKCFTVLADETTDIAGIQQMSLCVRFVENCIVREEFLQFLPVLSSTGKALADTILEGLNKCGVDSSHLIGQGYDGASAMSGAFRGAQAIIRLKYPKALYVHCSAHCLNLAVSSGCSIPTIRNCMAIIQKAYNFFNYPKRQRILEREIEKYEDITKGKKLKQLCATRWIERHDSVTAFVTLLEPLLNALEEISGWSDLKASSEAQILSTSISKCDFLTSLFILDTVFSLTLPVSRYLQTVNLDLALALQSVKLVRNSLQNVRNNADKDFSNLFIKIGKMCNDFNIQINKPRTANRQTMRNNVPAETVQDYFKRSIFIPFLDEFLNALDAKFVEHSEILQPFQLLIRPENETNTIEKINILKEFYTIEDDLSGEITLWHQFLASYKETPQPPSSAIEALCICNKALFPGIHLLLTIMATLPVTTCSNERSFSTLKILKSYLRNTISKERLNGLALMYIHTDVNISEDEILNNLSEKPRKIDIRLK